MPPPTAPESPPPPSPPTPLRPPAEPPATAAPRRWRAHPTVLVALLLASVLAGTVGLGLWHLQQDTLETQSQVLASLAGSSADELERGVQGVVLALQSTREDVRAGRPETVEQLQRRAAVLPLVRELWVLAADGGVLVASSHTPPPPMAEYLPLPTGLGEDSVAFSLPFQDANEGDASVALAIRWTHPGGARGWVLATMPAAAMLGAFPRAPLAPDLRLVVLRSDGAVLAGSLRQNARPGQRGEPVPLDSLTSDAPRRFDDDTLRLVQRRRIEPLGLTLVMTRDTEPVLSRWRDIRRTAGWGLFVVLLALSLLLWRLLQAEAHSRQLQRRLGRSRALESLGTLAGGVAHDFNNILAAVLGFGEMARASAAEGSAQARQLDQVVAAALRGKAVIARILAFSRGGTRPATVFALWPVVEQALGLLAATLPAGVRIDRVNEAPHALVRGDATALFEAVMNLCTNALQAMPQAGVLRVAVHEHVSAAAQELSHGSLPAGRHLVLEVSDTGAGMNTATLERLFEPFFSTRGQRGTGLGLAVVHGVVQDMDGAIDVHSRPGEGSRFSLWLPAATAPATAAAADADGAPADELPRGQGQVVLVVDDEAALVSLAEERLAELGYEPVGFVDAEQALAAVQADPLRFDGVLTDEVMPGLNGTALAQRLHAVRADLPVLLLSGFGGPQLQQRADAAGVRLVLAKPLRGDELARALAACLAPAPATPPGPAAADPVA